MMSEIDLSPETTFSIDFNLHWVPAALGLEVTPAAAAMMLGITEADYRAYTAQVATRVQQTASELLELPELRQAVEGLAVPQGGLVMAVGDSITIYRCSYARLLKAMLAIHRPEDQLRFINVAQSGYTSNHGLENTYTQFLSHQPDLVLINFGVNDSKVFGGPVAKTLVALAEYRANMTAILEAFLSHTPARPILLTPTPVMDEIVNTTPDFQAMHMQWRAADIQAQAEVMRELASHYGLPLVDLFNLFGPRPAPENYLPDGMHPGPAGHVLILKAVLRTLAEGQEN